MKKKNIELKDITSSPYFTIGIMVVVCALVIGVIAFLIMDINNVKKELIDARNLYKQNVREVAILEELKVQSAAAEKKLEACADVLPDGLGDVYVLQEKVVKVCQKFGLDVNSCEFTTVQNETKEVVFTINARGSYQQIYKYMRYYSSLEQIHRFDALKLIRETEDSYSVTFSLAILSENGVEGEIFSVETTAAQ